jgi:hypothetical protein
MDEIQAAINLSRNTSPGPDDIHKQMIRHRPPNAKYFLLWIYNRIWAENTFPSLWIKGTIIHMLKPGEGPPSLKLQAYLLN